MKEDFGQPRQGVVDGGLGAGVFQFGGKIPSIFKGTEAGARDVAERAAATVDAVVGGGDPVGDPGVGLHRQRLGRELQDGVVVGAQVDGVDRVEPVGFERRIEADVAAL